MDLIVPQFKSDPLPRISELHASRVIEWEVVLENHRAHLIENGIDPELAMIATRQPRTKGQLIEFVERVLSYRFSRGTIIMATDALTTGNVVPVDWLYSVYCLANGRSSDGAWRLLTEREIAGTKKEILLKGPRGGSKTETIAVLWWTVCWFCPNYSVTHSSTERAQSTTCLGYVLEWATSQMFNSQVTKANSQVGANIANGSRFVIRTGTLDGLNHEHTISLSLDEVETFPPELIGQAAQIPQKQVGSPYPSLMLLASTQKLPNLGMAKLIEAAIKTNRYLYLLWNVWDVGERCPEWRRDELPEEVQCSDYPLIIEEIGALEARMRTEPDEAFLQKLYGYRDQLKANCPLVIDCHGRLVHGTGHLAIDTLITRITTLDRETWVAENLCGEPVRKGAVYSKLSVENLSEEAVFHTGQIVYGGVDYGFNNALSVITLFGLNGMYVDCFYEYSAESVFEEDLVAVMTDLQNRYGVKKWNIDTAAVNLFRRARAAHLPCLRTSRKIPKLLKIDHVSRLICDGVGIRRLRYHPTNAYNTFQQMLHYRYRKNGIDPLDEDDDHCDSALYALELIRMKVPSAMQRRHGRVGHSLAGLRLRN